MSVSREELRQQIAAMLDDEGFGEWINSKECSDLVLAVPGVAAALRRSEAEQGVIDAAIALRSAEAGLDHSQKRSILFNAVDRLRSVLSEPT